MLTICTITWNNPEFTKKFIESTRLLEYPYELLIWNNGQDDETYDYLHTFTGEENYPNLKHLRVEHSAENKGMPICWNWALSYFEMGTNKYCFLCNNDIKFTKSTNKLVKFAEENPEYGMYCPAMLDRECYEKDDHTFAEKYALEKDGTVGLGDLNGPLMCLTQESIKKVGYFDTQFQFSFEDCDYYERCHKAGLEVVTYYGSTVMHYGGASTGKNPNVHNKQYYDLFQRKHGQ